MSTVFTKIIAGDLPGHFVYRDDKSVAFLSINPIRPGHTLVVPIEEVSHWVDLEPDLNAHLMRISQKVAKAQMEVFAPQRVGVMIAGFEVPHTHVHCVPVEHMSHLDFTQAEMGDPEDLDRVAELLKAKLQELGYGEAT